MQTNESPGEKARKGQVCMRIHLAALTCWLKRENTSAMIPTKAIGMSTSQAHSTAVRVLRIAFFRSKVHSCLPKTNMAEKLKRKRGVAK